MSHVYLYGAIGIDTEQALPGLGVICGDRVFLRNAEWQGILQRVPASANGINN
jgi:hypothetical protein